MNASLIDTFRLLSYFFFCCLLLTLLFYEPRLKQIAHYRSDFGQLFDFFHSEKCVFRSDYMLFVSLDLSVKRHSHL